MLAARGATEPVEGEAEPLVDVTLQIMLSIAIGERGEPDFGSPAGYACRGGEEGAKSYGLPPFEIFKVVP
jgi:hypothetical protein